jgi:hypothetical protein
MRSARTYYDGELAAQGEDGGERERSHRLGQEERADPGDVR